MRPHVKWIMAAALVLAFGLAACGSDDDSGDSGDAATGQTTAAATGESNDCGSSAQERADAAKAVVPLKAPESAIDMSKNEGKTIWFVNVLTNQFSAPVIEGFRDAAAAAGMKAQVVDSKGVVTRMNQGISQAVESGAAGIVISGINPELIADPLKRALDQGIPVVDVFNGDPDRPLDGFFAHVDPNYTEDGAKIADWVMGDSGCDATVGIFGLKLLEAQDNLAKGFQAQMEAECPDCEIVVYENIDASKVSTDTPPKVQNLLQREPDVGYVYSTFDGAVTFMGPAIQQTGSDVKIVSHDGVEANLEQMRDGSSPQILDVAFPPQPYLGWALVDQLARGMLDEEAADWSIPTRVIDETNIGESNADLWPEYQDFEGAFTEQWGVE